MGSIAHYFHYGNYTATIFNITVGRLTLTVCPDNHCMWDRKNTNLDYGTREDKTQNK